MRNQRNSSISESTSGTQLPKAGAFSLVEILVAMGLMSFIVLGLIMMFNQTQRAFRSSMQQVDLLESGRMVTEMISRELEQAAPAKAEPVYNQAGVIVYEKVNFFVEPASTFPSLPYIQALPGSSQPRTNSVQTLFFMSRSGQEWQGTGYVVLQDPGLLDVGTLYRFETTTRPPFVDYDMSYSFRSNIATAINTLAAKPSRPVTNLSRVVDGIIHFRVRTYSAAGEPLLPMPGLGTTLFCRLPGWNPNNDFGPVAGSWYGTLPADPSLAGVYFSGKTVPASVELEMGVLEPNIYERYKALADNPAAQRNYLSNRVANIHIFRQRVPIRNVDTSVYP